ncbi:MAG TPA: phycocyanin subunit beta, partial [Nostoc sp. UBA8866]|nr:phycocyanin subunit beta [Nostoc sp. UBA8866]
MLDAFSKVVEQADRKGNYLSGDEINALSALVA